MAGSPHESPRQLDPGRTLLRRHQPPDVPQGHRARRHRDPRDPRHDPGRDRLRRRGGRCRLHGGDAAPVRHTRQACWGGVRAEDPAPGLRQQRVHQARHRRHHAGRRLAAQPRPRAARRARRSRRRRPRDVLHGRLRPRDDGGHLRRRPGAGAALRALRRRQEARRRPEPQPQRPRHRQGACCRRLPGAGPALRQGRRRRVALRDPHPRDRRRLHPRRVRVAASTRP